ncbi:MAG: two-component system histidine kinase PnpS [Bacillota bacterium]
MKFRTRLFLFYIIGVGLVAIFLAVYFVNFEENRVRRSWHENELIQAKLIAANFTTEDRLKEPQVSETVRRLAKVSDGRVTVVDARGVVLGDSAQDYTKMGNHRNRPEIKKALSGTEGSSARFSATIKHRLIYVAYPISINQKIVGVARIAKEQNDLNNLLFRLKVLISGGIALTALLAFIFGWFAMRRVSEPVLELKRLAQRISGGDLAGRVRNFGHDELAELGVAFNGMAEKLADSFAAIGDEKRKLEVILENLVDGILVLDRNLKIILVNRAAQNILGLPSRNIQGRPVMEAVMNHHLLELIQEIHHCQKPFESELSLYYPCNRQLQVFLAPLKDDAGRLAGSIVVLNDLTQLKHLERVRQDFVANVSHELRTPITSIKAMVETLSAGAWEDREMLHRYLQAINKESDRLTCLINDLLELAKLDSKPAVPREPFDLMELIQEVKDNLLAINNNALDFEIKLPAEGLPLVDANRDQIKQVLTNLLDNAFKYTPAGGQVRLAAWSEQEIIKVAVADTGIGIPEKDLDRIFERFYRVDKGRSREKGGTGLGLSIVKHIVESYGGRVEVESSLNQGSVFTFSLPAKV